MENMEWGMALIFFGAIFLLMGLDLVEFGFRVLDPAVSTIIAVLALTCGVYLIAKNNKTE